MKTNDNNAKFEIRKPFFVLALPSGKISVRTILKVDLLDTGPENILFTSMCVYVWTFQPRNYTCWGSDGVEHHVYRAFTSPRAPCIVMTYAARTALGAAAAGLAGTEGVCISVQALVSPQRV